MQNRKDAMMPLHFQTCKTAATFFPECVFFSFSTLLLFFSSFIIFFLCSKKDLLIDAFLSFPLMKVYK